ncbi:MAG: DNA-3-methyladenine glycosylase 2 family protein [Chitinophagia bacterium]|jgi:DNA-3-methyladenine glycosylase II|nr:DNA-3-methyladenine glycosylase 2 family protein [Chitinophagia bacterium]NCA29216.1 DNA-3-methyladenine glycosylase 2 family protein [Chitinophagia bacterium]NDD15502.1 DNA-3-methyladenine glycosylase 2 family protein [Chitinophagia bacterium]
MSYQRHLKKDKGLATLVKAEAYTLHKRKNTAIRLIASIVSQQLSTKVAAIIFKRFLDIYKGKEPSMQAVIDTPFDTLRGIGLSNSKVNYVQNVAQFFLSQNITDKKLYSMEPEEVIALLTQIKGVGRWTVEMLLMFSLGHEDVFAVDDLGIQQAMIRLYKIKYKTKKELQTKMLKRSLAWSPYRTYACLHLWNWKDSGAV